jgi:WD40 repeat protein
MTYNFTADLMPLVECGTSEQGKPRWTSTGTYSRSTPWISLQTGKLVIEVSFSPHTPKYPTSGSRYHIATGGADDTIRIFDIRALQPIQTVPAHKSNVSDLRFFHSSSPHADLSLLTQNGLPNMGDAASMEERYRSGLYFASAGYDGKINIWSADDWQLIRSLTADADKVMSVDIAPDGELIASGSFSRNYQLFAAEGYNG